MGIKCEFCGAEYETPPGKFCDNCGRVLARINLEVVEGGESEFQNCPKCGLRNRLEDDICVNCGERLYLRRFS